MAIQIDSCDEKVAAVMTSDIVVSVVIPCFNDGQYINEALESVARQSVTGWEIIVIDDGSTDPHTCAVLENFHGDRIRVLHIRHQGPAAARNLGIGLASGRYILPLDADDRIADTYLEKAARILDANPDVEIVYCQADYFGLLQGKWRLKPYDKETFVLENMIFSTSMFRRSTWERVHGYSENMIYGMEDYDFWIKILSRGGKVHRIEEALFYYRVKPRSRTASMKQDNRKLEKLTYDTLFENNIEYFSQPENVRIIFQALRKSWVHTNAINTSFLWSYFLKYIVGIEVRLLLRLKRLLGR